MKIENDYKIKKNKRLFMNSLIYDDTNTKTSTLVFPLSDIEQTICNLLFEKRVNLWSFQTFIFNIHIKKHIK